MGAENLEIIPTQKVHGHIPCIHLLEFVESKKFENILGEITKYRSMWAMICMVEVVKASKAKLIIQGEVLES